MKAIVTKYLPATNNRGARIKASDGDRNSITIAYPAEYDTEQAHGIAAKALAHKMHWPELLVGGATKEGYAWCFLPDKYVRLEAIALQANKV